MEWVIISNEDQNSYVYVYFIENHEKNNNVNIFLSNNYEEADSLDLIQRIDNNKGFYISIYRFKIYPRKITNLEKFEVNLKLKDNNNNLFGKKITKLDMAHSNYLFDINFEESGILKKKKPPKSLVLSLFSQFKYFLNSIRNILKYDKNSKENEELILSIQKVLEKDTKYDLAFYLFIFSECNLHSHQRW